MQKSGVRSDFDMAYERGRISVSAEEGAPAAHAFTRVGKGARHRREGRGGDEGAVYSGDRWGVGQGWVTAGDVEAVGSHDGVSLLIAQAVSLVMLGKVQVRSNIDQYSQ